MPNNQDAQYFVNAPETTSNNNAVVPPSTAKYEIKYHTFPTDLLDPSLRFPNYVMFYINVPEESKMFKDEKATEGMDRSTIDIDASLRQLGELRGKAVKGGLELSTVAAGVAGGVGVKAVSSIFGDNIASKLSTLDAGVLGAFTADFAFKQLGNRAAGFTRPSKRLKTAIALHIPNNVAVNYSVNYEDSEMGMMGHIAQLAAADPEVASKLSTALDQWGLNPFADLSAAKSAIADVASGGALGKGISSLIASSVVKNSAALGFFSGLAANPRREQLFQSVNFRKFTMDYQFAARGIDEARNILNIIHLFKYHMHPEFLDESNFLYIYPSEFDIVYYRGTKENPAFHRHTSCVLTGLDVNYTPNGMLSLLNNGVPMQINVSMQFTELALLTKQKINAMENPDLNLRTPNSGFDETNRPEEI